MWSRSRSENRNRSRSRDPVKQGVSWRATHETSRRGHASSQKTPFLSCEGRSYPVNSYHILFTVLRFFHKTKRHADHGHRRAPSGVVSCCGLACHRPLSAQTAHKLFVRIGGVFVALTPRMSYGLRDGTDFSLARAQVIHPERSCGCIPKGNES